MLLLLLSWFECFSSPLFAGSNTTTTTAPVTNDTTVAGGGSKNEVLSRSVESLELPECPVVILVLTMTLLFFAFLSGDQHCGHRGPHRGAWAPGRGAGGPPVAPVRGEEEEADGGNVPAQRRGAVGGPQRGDARRSEAAQGGETHLRRGGRPCCLRQDAMFCTRVGECSGPVPPEAGSA